MLGAEGFQNYIIKYQSKNNSERLKIIIEDIVKSGKIQKDDLTIVIIIVVVKPRIINEFEKFFTLESVCAVLLYVI